jgi:asparagine synthase (glutamine-hydrolysing)
VWFHRLAIIDPSAAWDQPFVFTKQDGSLIYVVCNGEIFNYRAIVSQYGLSVQSGSDCEVIGLLYIQYGIDVVVDVLLWEFAFVIYDMGLGKIIAARDPIGVRPLFLWTNVTWSLSLWLCSELKGLSDLYEDVIPYPPGKYSIYDIASQTMDWHMYYSYSYVSQSLSMDALYKKIRDVFTDAVRIRLMADRPLGCLLSWWLDSSICAAIAAKYSDQPIQTFTIGMDGATDVPYAHKVADHIGSRHTTFYVSAQEALDCIEKTIYTIESFDITTVRASVWQYILGQKIAEQTDVKVLLCGELSDELMSGYKYFHKAPDAQRMHQENIRLVQDVHLYDGLRTDRTMAQHWLEVRLPFADIRFVDYILSVDPVLRMPNDGVEKYLFRQAFADAWLLPDEVLWRSKEALSDGTSSVQKSWFTLIQEYIDTIVSDEEFLAHKDLFVHCPPQTKEAYYYRKVFVSHFGEKHTNVVPYFWLPKWCGDVIDPSARVLVDVYK